MSDIILTSSEIESKLERMAYQILEANNEHPEIVLAGISHNGYAVAERISYYFHKISSKKVFLCKVVLNKKNPLDPITTSLSEKEYVNKSVTVVDDVLQSGTTLIYAVRHFLSVPLQQCNTAVLVDRNHKKYPIKVDFKGVSLSTSMNENVAITVNKDGFTAMLE